jgi:hypothetical protein
MLQVREHIPTPSDVFIVELAFESYEEFGGASTNECGLAKNFKVVFVS